jgi:hypothetical protein
MNAQAGVQGKNLVLFYFFKFRGLSRVGGLMSLAPLQHHPVFETLTFKPSSPALLKKIIFGHIPVKNYLCKSFKISL